MILLVKPPYNPAVFRAGESLGLSVLGATVKRQGIPVKLLDATLLNMSLQGLMGEIKRNAPSLVGLSITCGSFLPGAVQVAREIKKWNKTVHVTAGGPYPSFACNRILEDVPEIDTIIRFEGELSLPSLYRRLQDPGAWSEIPNLCFREGQQVHANSPAPPLKDLDSLPWPLRDSRSFGPGIRDVALLSSRGCTWDCAYCIQARLYQHSGWRSRTAADIVNEMKHLREDWRAGAFLFHDDNFFGSSRPGRERALELARLLVSEGMTLPLALSALPMDVESSLFGQLKKAGLKQVFLGVESGVQAALNRWNKKVTVAQNRKAMEILKDLGLGLEVGFVSFDPYTTLEELRENVEFLRSCQCAGTAPLLNRLEIHEGMALADRMRTEGRLLEKDGAHAYRIEDDRVERVYFFLHRILPALGEAEHVQLRMRFESQTRSERESRRSHSKELRKLEKRLSDQACRTAAEVIRFVQNKSTSGPTADEAFIADKRSTLLQFSREYSSLHRGP